MKNEGVLGKYFTQAKSSLKKGDRDKARDYADMGIVSIVGMRESGQLKDGDSIEGHPMDKWIMRFWVFLEKNNLMLG